MNDLAFSDDFDEVLTSLRISTNSNNSDVNLLLDNKTDEFLNWQLSRYLRIGTPNIFSLFAKGIQIFKKKINKSIIVVLILSMMFYVVYSFFGNFGLSIYIVIYYMSNSIFAYSMITNESEIKILKNFFSLFGFFSLLYRFVQSILLSFFMTSLPDIKPLSLLYLLLAGLTEYWGMFHFCFVFENTLSFKQYLKYSVYILLTSGSVEFFILLLILASILFLLGPVTFGFSSILSLLMIHTSYFSLCGSPSASVNN